MRRFVICTAIAFVVPSIPATVLADCVAPADSELPACLELNDNHLWDTYGRLMAVLPERFLDEHEKARLRDDQREWLKQRDAKCRLTKEMTASKDWLKTLVVDKVKATCVVEISRERGAMLDRLSKVKREEADKAIAAYNEKLQSGDRAYLTPKIPTRGKALLDFVPRGYAILEKIEADFNGDGKKDIALILGSVPEIIPYPRPLLILFATSDGGFIVSARNDRVASTGEDGGVANPQGADALKLKGRSVLVEDFGGGSGSVGGRIDEFRYQNGAWYLVAMEEWESPRNAQDMEVSRDGWGTYKKSARTDLLTGKVDIVEYQSNEKTSKERKHRVRASDVTPEPLKRLDEVQYQ